MALSPVNGTAHDAMHLTATPRPGRASPGAADHLNRSTDPTSASERAASERDHVDRPAESPTPDTVQVQFDDETNQYVLRWYDPKSGELVRQFPVEALRRLAAQISRTIGLIVDQRL